MCLVCIACIVRGVCSVCSVCSVSEGKPPWMRRLCLKTSEAAGLGITFSSEEVYELML